MVRKNPWLPLKIRAVNIDYNVSELMKHKLDLESKMTKLREEVIWVRKLLIRHKLRGLMNKRASGVIDILIYGEENRIVEEGIENLSNAAKSKIKSLRKEVASRGCVRLDTALKQNQMDRLKNLRVMLESLRKGVKEIEEKKELVKTLEKVEAEYRDDFVTKELSKVILNKNKVYHKISDGDDLRLLYQICLLDGKSCTFAFGANGEKIRSLLTARFTEHFLKVVMDDPIKKKGLESGKLYRVERIERAPNDFVLSLTIVPEDEWLESKFDRGVKSLPKVFRNEG